MVRRRGLIRSAVRTAGRTAVIAGTATAVSKRVAGHQRERVAQREPLAQRDEHPDSTANGADLVGRLHTLADLKAMGALTDQEFAAAKTRLLKD